MYPFPGPRTTNLSHDLVKGDQNITEDVAVEEEEGDLLLPGQVGQYQGVQYAVEEEVEGVQGGVHLHHHNLVRPAPPAGSVRTATLGDITDS